MEDNQVGMPGDDTQIGGESKMIQREWRREGDDDDGEERDGVVFSHGPSE